MNKQPFSSLVTVGYSNERLVKDDIICLWHLLANHLLTHTLVYTHTPSLCRELSYFSSLTREALRKDFTHSWLNLSILVTTIQTALKMQMFFQGEKYILLLTGLFFINSAYLGQSPENTYVLKMRIREEKSKWQVCCCHRAQMDGSLGDEGRGQSAERPWRTPPLCLLPSLSDVITSGSTLKQFLCCQ